MQVCTTLSPNYPSWQAKELDFQDDQSVFQKSLEEIEWMISCLYTRLDVRHNENLLLRQLQIYYDARQKIHSLKTRCRAARNLYPSITDILHFQGQVLSLERRLHDQAATLIQAVLHSTSTNPEIQWWQKQLEHDVQNLFLRKDEQVNRFSHHIDERMVLPLEAMHAQIMSMMRIQTRSCDGVVSHFGFARCVNVLKASEDIVLRQSTFENFFAWLATNAAPLCSLLNAITGYRQTILDSLELDFLRYITHTENIKKNTLTALRDSLLEFAPQTQHLVYKHAHALGFSSLPLAYLNAPALHTKHRFSFTVQDCLHYIRKSTEVFDPTVTQVLNTALEKHWIDMRPSSGKAGTSWCDSLPSEKEFRIFSSFHPTLSYLWQIMHLLGVARLFREIGKSTHPILGPSIIQMEIIGQLYTTMLENYIVQLSQNDPRTAKIVQWQKENRQINMLLSLPVRHFFTERMMRKRAQAALSIHDMNHIAKETWHDFFADSTKSCDTYFWAYKTHFYKSQTFCYDWQYSMGYLLSFPILQAIEKQEIPHWERAMQEFIYLDVESWFAKYLGLDIQKKETWQKIFSLL